jgi:hypothetical protein
LKAVRHKALFNLNADWVSQCTKAQQHITVKQRTCVEVLTLHDSSVQKHLMQQHLPSPQQIAQLLQRANDEAVKQKWYAGRSLDHTQSQLQFDIPNAQLGFEAGSATVNSKLPSDASAVVDVAQLTECLGSAAAAHIGSSNSSSVGASGFTPHWMLAPHNSKPNSGTLLKQPIKAESHKHGVAAVVYGNFSSLSTKNKPPPVSDSQSLPGRRLKLVRIQGRCTVTPPPAGAAAAAATAAAAAAGAAAGPAQKKQKQTLPGLQVEVNRYHVWIDSLPVDIQQQQQQGPMRQLDSFKAHEDDQQQQKQQAKADGKEFEKQAYEWQGPPLVGALRPVCAWAAGLGGRYCGV